MQACFKAGKVSMMSSDSDTHSDSLLASCLARHLFNGWAIHAKPFMNHQ